MPYYPTKAQELVETIETVIDRIKASVTDAATPGVIRAPELASILLPLADAHYLAMEREAFGRASDALDRYHALPRDHAKEIATLRARRPGGLPVIVARRIDDQAAAG